MTSLRQRFIEDMQIRNLAVNTQDYYVQQVSRFARHFNKTPVLLGPEQVRAYQVYLTNEKKLATSSILDRVRNLTSAPLIIIASPGRSSNTNPDIGVFRSVGAFSGWDLIHPPQGHRLIYLKRFNNAAGA